MKRGDSDNYFCNFLKPVEGSYMDFVSPCVTQNWKLNVFAVDRLRLSRSALYFLQRRWTGKTDWLAVNLVIIERHILKSLLSRAFVGRYLKEASSVIRWREEERRKISSCPKKNFSEVFLRKNISCSEATKACCDMPWPSGCQIHICVCQFFPGNLQKMTS